MDGGIEIFRGMCNTWECDENGHLNVRHYVAKIGEGLPILWHELGLTRQVREELGAEMVVTDMHLRFLREVHPGRGLYGRAGIVETGQTQVRVYAELLNGHTDEVAATLNILLEWRDEATGEAKALPADFAAACQTLRVEVPAHGAPRSLELDSPAPAMTLAQSETMKMFDIGRGMVLPTEVDGKRRMKPEHYIGRISDGVVHLTRHFRPKDTGRDRAVGKYGGAVLEYRLRFQHPVMQDDIVVMRSGLKHVGEKANHMVHLTFNGETGQLMSSAEAIGITLDLEARKVVPLPEDRRQHLQGLVAVELAG